MVSGVDIANVENVDEIAFDGNRGGRSDSLEKLAQ